MSTVLAPDQYLEQRLDDQINWYDKKGQTNKWWFVRLSVAQVIAAAAIPFLAGYASESATIKVFVGFLGAVTAVLASVNGLLQFQKNWIDYRATCESLKKEKYLYLTKAEPYSDTNAFAVLVQRVETLVSKENTGWAQQVPKPGAPAEQQKGGQR
jgi:hypothetical protein